MRSWEPIGGEDSLVRAKTQKLSCSRLRCKAHKYMYYGLKWFKIIWKWHQTFKAASKLNLDQHLGASRNNEGKLKYCHGTDALAYGFPSAWPKKCMRPQPLWAPAKAWITWLQVSWCKRTNIHRELMRIFIYEENKKQVWIFLVGVCWLRCWLYLSRISCATFMSSKFSRNISNSALLAAPVTFLPSHSSASCVSRPLPPLEAVQERPLHGNAWCLSRAYIT